MIADVVFYTASAGIVETVDIFPTPCDLPGLNHPKSGGSGISLQPQIRTPSTAGHSAIGYYGSTQTIHTTNYRRVQDKDGYTEPYDYRQPNAESTNLATHQPETVSELQKQPKARTKIGIK